MQFQRRVVSASRPRGRFKKRKVPFHLARLAKERAYPEPLGAGRSRLVVLGLENGGRWSHESPTFINLLAKHKATATSPQGSHHRADFEMDGPPDCHCHALIRRQSPHAACVRLPPPHNGDGPCPPRSVVSLPSATLRHSGLSTAGPWPV